MEVVVRKTDLLRELQLFQGIVERKNTIPILANVLLEANGTEVKMLATDLEVGLRSKCTATVSKGGSLTLPAKKFFEIVKSLPETDIRIALVFGDANVGLWKRLHNLEEFLGRQRERARLRDGAGASTAQPHFEIRREKADLVALRVHQHIRENRNRIFSLDDSLKKLQFSQ